MNEIDPNQKQNQQPEVTPTAESGATTPDVNGSSETAQIDQGTSAESNDNSNDFSVRLQEIMQLPPDQQKNALDKFYASIGGSEPQAVTSPQAIVTPIDVAKPFATIQTSSLQPQDEFDALVARKEYLWLKIGGLSLYHMAEEWKEIEQIDARLNDLWNGGKSGIVRKEDKR